MDRIHIRDLALRCIIGVYPEERTHKQDILINVTMGTNLRAAGKSDALEDTVDYKSIKLEILDFVENSSFQLIESLAEGIAAICLKADRVQSATVTIDKPGALRFTRSVAVEVTRRVPQK
ncbi:MAG: D-erythro-7,8-dihydroneopterin triphosphate epimerase [Verrucomicrobiota bacterium]|jgi:dihydroneopterin aldolase/D-erythro-7,8-dihydroneopterin triphosphate epimerase|nr:D-erythro-7,8-dihydroneopterin triphosphate epimerase [Verrucomicrobiota bacterium]MDK2963738.1 D-erythro-7,8-dihydroneopterin triphosphate epimerase [Verrucomicrobiota bacterium]